MPDEIYLTPEQDESLEAAWEKLSARWHGQKPRLLPRIALRNDGELVGGDGNGNDGEVPFADQPGVLEALQEYARRRMPLPLAGDTVAFAARRVRVSLPKPYEEGKHPRGYHGRWRDANAAHQQAEEVLKAHEKALGKSAEKIDALQERHEEAKAAYDAAKAKASAAGSTRAALETHQAHLAAIKARGEWQTAKAAHTALRKIHTAAKKEHTATKRELSAATKEKVKAEKKTKPATRAKPKVKAAAKAKPEPKAKPEAKVKPEPKVKPAAKAKPTPKAAVTKQTPAERKQALKDDIATLADEHIRQTSVGPAFDKLYEQLQNRHPDVTPEEFKVAIKEMHDADPPRLRISGWPKMLSDLPRPELAVLIGHEKVGYFAQPTLEQTNRGFHLGAVQPPRPDFTGTDALGRQWANGKEVKTTSAPGKVAPPPAAPTPVPKPPPPAPAGKPKPPKPRFTGKDPTGHCWQSGKMVPCPDTAEGTLATLKEANGDLSDAYREASKTEPSLGIGAFHDRLRALEAQGVVKPIYAEGLSVDLEDPETALWDSAKRQVIVGFEPTGKKPTRPFPEPADQAAVVDAVRQAIAAHATSGDPGDLPIGDLHAQVDRVLPNVATGQVHDAIRQLRKAGDLLFTNWGGLPMDVPAGLEPFFVGHKLMAYVHGTRQLQAAVNAGKPAPVPAPASRSGASTQAVTPAEGEPLPVPPGDEERYRAKGADKVTAEQVRQVLDTWQELEDRTGKHNLVELHHLIPALANRMTKAQAHATIQRLRLDGILTANGAEGRFGVTPQEQEYGLYEPGSHAVLRLLNSVSRRVDPEEMRDYLAQLRARPRSPRP